jgi:Tfp pilus assembly PilM family ATPase
MHTSLFFKLFPPPKFLVMKHVGLDISDDSIHCLEYSGRVPNLKIAKYATFDIPKGIIEGGDIKDEKAFSEVLLRLDHDYDLSYVKVSVPEEKAYLFQTDISTTNPLAIAQNVEFKLEENVPLSVADAVFYFDILPMSVTGGELRASVSVVPRVYIEKIVQLLRNAGVSPMAFEVVPKSIARSVLTAGAGGTVMIIHIMKEKTGIYIVAGGVVCFTFTVAWGSQISGTSKAGDVSVLTKEVDRIYEYWISHGTASANIEKIILVGHDAPAYESEISKIASRANLPVSIGNAWTNSFSLNEYIPEISKEDSLDYAVAAGLAMDL